MNIFELNKTEQVNIVDYYDCPVMKSFVETPREDEKTFLLGEFKSNIEGKSKQELSDIKSNIEKAIAATEETIINRGSEVIKTDSHLDEILEYQIFVKSILSEELTIIKSILEQ